MPDMPISENREIKKTLEIEHRAKSGASWFFWIAGLSMANSILLVTGANVGFPVGLGVTQIVDAAAFQAGANAQVIGLALSAMVASIFVFFGVMARKNQPWAFVAGLVLYAADGLLFLIISDWLSIAFHAWGFLGILSGLRAAKRIRAMQPTMPVLQTSVDRVHSLQR